MIAYICPVQAADSWQCVWIYLRVCMYCIVDTSWQRLGIVPPMVYLHLTQAGAWCEMWFISAMLPPLCSEHNDIYWAAHNTTLITDHQLYPLSCGCVINVTSLAWDIFSVTPSFWFLNYVFSSAPCSFSKIDVLQSAIDTVQFLFSFSSILCNTVGRSLGLTYVLVIYLLVGVGEDSK